jgi:spore coat protein H
MSLDRQPPFIRHRRSRWPGLALGLLLAGLGAWWWLGANGSNSRRAAAGGAGPTVQPDKDSALFGLTKVHAVEFTIPASEWSVLQSDTVVSRGGRGGGFGGSSGAPEGDYRRASDGRMMHRGGGFGGIFPWVTADLKSGDTTLAKVGLRYKGNASYTASQFQLRRNLKVKTDFFGKAPGLGGEKTLDFNAGALDPSRLRESLSFSVFRAAGVPAPRTAYAEVTLTVPGEYDREYVGLYTLVEQVNKSFAKEFLPGEKGLLLKPEGLSGGIAYYGEDWSRYDSVYRPEREPTDAEAQRVIDFARLVARAGDTEFRREIGSYLEVDEFLRYIAVNALLVNLDSYLGGRHNFYVYLNPDDSRFLFIPWDQDLSLGSFGGGRGGAPGAILDLSLLHPYTGQNPLIARVLAMPELKERYLAIVRELVATAFSRATLLKTIDTIEATTRQALAREAGVTAQRGERPGQTGFPGMAGRGVTPRDFVEQRLASVQRQLEGKSEGTIPGGGFGGGPGRGGPGRGGRGGF